MEEKAREKKAPPPTQTAKTWMRGVKPRLMCRSTHPKRLLNNQTITKIIFLNKKKKGKTLRYSNRIKIGLLLVATFNAVPTNGANISTYSPVL